MLCYVIGGFGVGYNIFSFVMEWVEDVSVIISQFFFSYVYDGYFVFVVGVVDVFYDSLYFWVLFYFGNYILYFFFSYFSEVNVFYLCGFCCLVGFLSRCSCCYSGECYGNDSRDFYFV